MVGGVADANRAQRRSAARRNPQPCDVSAWVTVAQFGDAPAVPVGDLDSCVSDGVELSNVNCGQRQAATIAAGDGVE